MLGVASPMSQTCSSPPRNSFTLICGFGGGSEHGTRCDFSNDDESGLHHVSCLHVFMTAPLPDGPFRPIIPPHEV